MNGLSRSYSVGIGSLGTVGLEVARRIVEDIPGLRVSAVSARDVERARGRLGALGCDAAVVPIEELHEHCDVLVECAPTPLFRAMVEPAIRAGKTIVPIGVAALIENLDLVDLAAETGARIWVPSGALLGLDAVRAAAECEIATVTMITRKPPGGLAGAPHLLANQISVEGLNAPLKVFEGTAREGARGFPANVNVAAALGLAGIGPDRTRLEIWADPTVERNTHHITVEADAVRFRLEIEGVPTDENPATGRLVAPSVIATLRRLVAPLVVGT